MPSRSVRRRRIKRAARNGHRDPEQVRLACALHLRRWTAEAIRRARDLGEPAAWALAAEKRPVAMALDPSGDLAGDLERACAEAVSRAAGRHLVGVSRPLADRVLARL